MTRFVPPALLRRPCRLAAPFILCAVLLLPVPGRGGDCPPTGERVAIAVTIASAGGPSPGGLALALDYPSAAVALPGTGEGPEVRERVHDTPDGFLVAASDREDSLRLALAAGGPTLPDGPLLSVTFDRCGGSPSPALTAFACRIRTAADEFGQPIDNVTCALDLEAAPAAAPNPTEVGLR